MVIFMKKITDYIDDRKNSFDLIRLFAALLVLYAHSYHIFGLGADPLTAITGIYSGTIAVYMFFCISGFFISKSVVERTPLEFIVARCARIFPALFFCNLFTITLILPWVLVDRSWFDFVFSLESVSYIYKNTSLLWGLEFTMPIVFDAHPDQAVNGSLWTLPVELQAYVLVFLFFALGWFSNKVRFNTIVCVILSTYVEYPSFYNLLIPLSSSHALFLAFLIGSALYINKDWLPIDRRSLLTSLILAWTTYLLDYRLISLFLFCYMLLSLGFLFKGNRLRLSNDYSYGIYLYAYPMSQLSFHFFSNNFYFYFIFILLGVVFFSYISWHFFEKPIMHFSKNLLSRKNEKIIVT